MSDLLHTHSTFGFVVGCPACDQVNADLLTAQAFDALMEDSRLAASRGL